MLQTFHQSEGGHKKTSADGDHRERAAIKAALVDEEITEETSAFLVTPELLVRAPTSLGGPGPVDG